MSLEAFDREDGEEYDVLEDKDFPPEWGWKFEPGFVVLTSPAVPVGATSGAIPIGHRIRLSRETLRNWLRQMEHRNC